MAIPTAFFVFPSGSTYYLDMDTEQLEGRQFDLMLEKSNLGALFDPETKSTFTSDNKWELIKINLNLELLRKKVPRQ